MFCVLVEGGEGDERATASQAEKMRGLPLISLFQFRYSLWNRTPESQTVKKLWWIVFSMPWNDEAEN